MKEMHSNFHIFLINFFSSLSTNVHDVNAWFCALHLYVKIIYIIFTGNYLESNTDLLTTLNTQIKYGNLKEW